MCEKKRRVWRVCSTPDGYTPEDFLAEEKRAREKDARYCMATLKKTCKGKFLDEIATTIGVQVKTLPFALWQLDARGRRVRQVPDVLVEKECEKEEAKIVERVVQCYAQEGGPRPSVGQAV